MQTDSAIKEFLDSLSQVPGSILYRDLYDWLALAPGNPGEVLRLSDSLFPYWGLIPSYVPGFMSWPASSAYYSRTSQQFSNAKCNFFCRFKAVDDSTVRPFIFATASGYWMYFIALTAWDDLDVFIWDNTGSLVCRQRSTFKPGFNQIYSLFHYYDPATAATSFLLDGEDIDDLSYSGRVVTTGTLRNMSNTEYRIGADNYGPRTFHGMLGYVGFKQGLTLDPSLFFDQNSLPKPLDKTTWTEFSGQPPIFHESGKLDENRGSFGGFSRTGSITLADAQLWQ